VIYEDKVRRFNARVINEKLLDLSFDGLRAKIASLFNFGQDINEQTLLTYIDEDGDVVTLADDEDLQDIVNQSLNPLRITVTDQIVMTKLHDQSKAATNLDKKKKDKGKKINMTTPKVAKGSTHYFAEPSIWGPTPLPSIWSPNTDQFPSTWGPNPPKVANNITKEGKDVSDEAHSISTCSTHYFAEPSIWGPTFPLPPLYDSGVVPPPPAIPLPSFEANPRIRRFTTQTDGSEIIYHHGIRCDGCGVHPITGPRFMSKQKTDYDLCTKCFSKMGQDTDYIKQDHAMEYQPHIYHQVSSRGLKVKSSGSNLDSEFVMDVNMVDGTTKEPLAPFFKIWRMRNNGKVAWPHKTQLVWVGGDNLSTMTSRELNIPVTGWGVGQELDVFVDFIAPELPGRYVSYWRMASPYGKRFGQRIWVLIEVDASLEKKQPESVCGLNLNIPPIDTSSSVSGPQTVSVEPNSTAKDKKQNMCPITFSEPAPTCLPSFLMKGGVPELGVEKCFEEGDVKDNESYGFGDNEWDTILVELEEMGFDDVEMNKVLLKKNNGSIKRVVMDLIDGED
ncbi:hypothetical protein RD792_004814, partial [Penstemon davidsonii]